MKLIILNRSIDVGSLDRQRDYYRSLGGNICTYSHCIFAPPQPSTILNGWDCTHPGGSVNCDRYVLYIRSCGFRVCIVHRMEGGVL